MHEKLHKKPKYRILEDSWLESYASDIELRMSRYEMQKEKILGNTKEFTSFANGHLYFGFHPSENGWVFREWAPNASEMYLIGDFNGWNRTSHPMTKLEKGVFEIFLEGENALTHESLVKISIHANGVTFDRIPLYCKRVVQNTETNAFDGQIWNPSSPYKWNDSSFSMPKEEPFIYECHIGMSGEKAGITTYAEFKKYVLPRVKSLGYNTIQLMAIMEHPYYASFGYQVTNFYAVSSRFGTPEDLKQLIDTAHEMEIAVLLDVVHSHASSNVFDGIAQFDGTEYQFFHEGSRGNHSAWGTKLFNYGKPEVIHFLLSNLQFWLSEYHFDGFRFDGVTSMLYNDNGLGGVFDDYGKYFSMNTDIEAVTYLQFAAELCKEIKPECLLIAEDMSGMPGMCLPIQDGGIGFDYRLAMGIPDFWIRTLREVRDEDWDLGTLWHELTSRRLGEKAIGYCESHDQALVGDKTVMFWLADKEMYWSMSNDSQSHVIDRAISLHKMIRLITCVCAGEGYLTFMGNEFGHPEWIDFPREGNGWSYHYAQRRWSLADDEGLRYGGLRNFDMDMVKLVKENHLLSEKIELLYQHNDDKIIAFSKGGYIFLFNFHPNNGQLIRVNAEKKETYTVVINSEWHRYSGFKPDDVNKPYMVDCSGCTQTLDIFIQNRTAIVLKPNDLISFKL